MFARMILVALMSLFSLPAMADLTQAEAMELCMEPFVVAQGKLLDSYREDREIILMEGYKKCKSVTETEIVNLERKVEINPVITIIGVIAALLLAFLSVRHYSLRRRLEEKNQQEKEAGKKLTAAQTRCHDLERQLDEQKEVVTLLKKIQEKEWASFKRRLHCKNS